MNITQQLLRETFDYDEVTGVLTRKPCVGTRWQPLPITHARDPRGYLKTRVGKRQFFVHRLVWMYVNGEWPIHEIDHLNRNPGDNRIENLRDVPRAVNIANRRGWAKPKPVRKERSTGSIEFVEECRSNPYRARIAKGGKRISIGYFETPDAARAAIAAHTLSTGQLPSII